MTTLKRLLTLLLVSTLTLSVWGETATFTATGAHTSEGDWTLTVKDITISWHGADVATDIRVYKGKTLTITSSAGNISALNFTYSGSDNGGWNTSYTGLSTTSWSKTTSSGKSGKQAKITQLIVTYEGGGASCGTDPTVGSIMNAVSSITATGATFSTSAGVSAGTDCSLDEVGFVYNTTGTPTTSDTKAVITSYTSGNLNKSVTGLSASTTYYVRAYAKNEHGTTYSDQKSFTTEALPTYAIRFFNNGTQIDATQNIAEGSSPVVPSDPAACDEGYTFVGWWTDELAEDNTTAETWITDFTVSGAQDYYAVFSHPDDEGGGTVTFNFATIAEANGWTHDSNHPDISISPINIHVSKTSGSYQGRWWNNDKTFRIYAANTITISSTAGDITAVSSEPSRTFTISDGKATYNAATNFTSISVTYGTTYYTTDCGSACSTPTLEFDVIEVNKFKGDVPFIKTATLSNNPLGGTITYSSSLPSKAEVNATTGEVTIHDAMSSTPVVITATVNKVTSGVECQKKVTASYTLNIYNKVTWKVSGSDYTMGHPTVRTAEGGEIETMPTNPDEDACGGKVFVGWTDAPYEENDAAPTHLYKALGDFPHITANTTFHAVFAESSGDAHKFARLNNDADFVRAIGTKIAIVSNAQENILQNDFTSVAAPTPDGSGLISVTDNQIWTLTGQDTYGYWILKSGDVQLGVEADEGYTEYELCGNYSTDASSWSVMHASNISGTSNCFYFYNWYESSPEYYDLLEFYGGSTNKWESVYFNSVNTNFKNYGAMRVYGPAVTYTKYATACCDEVETPVVSVVARSTKATLSWQSQGGATNGFSVVVKQGESVIYTNTTLAAGTTSCEATGLSPNTSYTYTVTAKGATCNRSTSGNFTTTDCEDVPYDIAITPSLKSIKVRWTAETATATINLYSDEECSTTPVKSVSDVTSPATIDGLAENTTYYVKVLAGGSCASLPVEVITLSTDIVIAEWFPDGIKINLTADDASASVIIENKDNTSSTTTSYADSLFFSKYFEAAASTKLLAVFNGTDHPIDLSDYKLAIAQATTVFTLYRFSDMTYDKNGVETHFTDQQLFLPPGKEIILISYPSSTADLAIIDCAQSNANSGFASYFRMTSPYLQFNGDDAVGLVNPQGNLIDLIGAGSLSGGSDVSAVETTSQSGASGGTFHGFMDKPGGWYTEKGYHAEDNNTETNNYALSTNRCLLIRRNHVKSGLDAVARNSEDFVTLGDYVYLGDDYEGEWKGVQIPGAGCNDGNCAGITASCEGFDKVGSYDYNTYYATFDSIAELKELGGKQNDDGTYTIPIEDLDELSCTMLRVKVYDGETEKALRDYKVPIMVEGSKMTNNAIFNKHEVPTCKECDVVILKGATLEKTNGANDRDEVRNLMIYPGGTLIVPSGKGDYTVQSIQFRVEKETAPLARLQGNLLTKDGQVLVSRRINNSRYYFFSLPYDCNIDEVRWSNGTPATNGVDYRIAEYDSETRAAEGSTKGAPGHYKQVTGNTLKAGVGYVIATNDRYLKELVFPMDIGSTNLTTAENTKTTNKVALHQYTGSSSINNHNWNLIAHPYVSAFNAYDDAKITAGWLKCTTPATPDNPNGGEWEYVDAGNVYLTKPSYNADKTTYTQTLSSTVGTINPFLAVFVQAAGEGDMTFDPGDRILSAPARHLAAQAEKTDESIFVGVTLSGNGQSDQTNLRIRPDFTDEYQLGYDLLKFTTYYTARPQIFMKTPSHQLAFQAVNDSVAKNNFLPMGVYCEYAGTYTFALDEHYPIDEVEAVYLYDKTTGTTTNLLYDTYTITTSGRINTTSRFSLNVWLNRKAPQITTGIDGVEAPDGITRKILINNHVYIQRGGAIYDVTGKEVFNF